ncbi:MAG: thioredoxin [Moraxellaceae bacterium]|nr:MAG: thioredoxin [Moraxellaceae bacterium]
MFFKKKKSKTPKTVEITDQNFNELVMASKVPVLLDIWAPWCGPCRMIGPIIDEIAEDFEGRALIGKVSADTNPKISELFKIKSIPTLLFLQKDELVERFSGLVPKPNVVEILEELIAERNAEK